MQVCTKNTCMGYSVNVKNDPDSFVRGDEDDTLIDYICSSGVYKKSGGLETNTDSSDSCFGNPFDDPEVMSVEIVRNNSSDKIIYDVYVATEGRFNSVAVNKIQVNKSGGDHKKIKTLNMSDVGIRETPMYKSGNTGAKYHYNPKLSKETNAMYNRAFNSRSTPELKTMKLAEIRKTLNDNRIIRLPDGRFSVPLTGKYDPNMTFIVPAENTMQSDTEWSNPIDFRDFNVVAKNINIPFNASDFRVIFGDYAEKNGKQIFEVKPYEEAKHLLIKADWGGPSDNTRGISTSDRETYVKGNDEILAFKCASSNGGGSGCDYYVMKNTDRMRDDYDEFIENTEIKTNQMQEQRILDSDSNRAYYKVFKDEENTNFGTSNITREDVMKLADARKASRNDLTVQMPDGRFSVPCYGKYEPNITIIVPQENTMKSNGYWKNPVGFEDMTMFFHHDYGIPFNASDIGVMFGKFTIKDGENIFEKQPCDQAEHVLIQANWGGAFNSTRGIKERDMDEWVKNNSDVLKFRRASSNGGGSGYDYYVVKNTNAIKQNYRKE